jgi:predicted NBD/HSP70 family sugar kinase
MSKTPFQAPIAVTRQMTSQPVSPQDAQPTAQAPSQYPSQALDQRPKIKRPIDAMGPRERQFAAILWQHQRLSVPLGRSHLAQMTQTHPTLTGIAVANLLDSGLVREGPPINSGEPGKRQIRLDIDTARRQFLGLSIAPGELRLGKLNALGESVSKELIRKAVKPDQLITAAAKLLEEYVDKSVIQIGITVTGVVDPLGHVLLFSSAMPSSTPVSLEPIYKAAGKVPIILDNDLHALSSRWMLQREIDTQNDEVVLLVGLDDGRLGASVLIHGKPQPGSVVSANELGHTRLPIETDRCFCGQTGCLERIFSSSQLRRLGKSKRSLADLLASPAKDDKHLSILLDHLVTGLSNAINFIRPSRLVIASPLVAHARIVDQLTENLPAKILPGLRPQVRLSFWEQPCVQSAENAAWLALADIFLPHTTQ